ncbi:hypothetical protein [Paenibacillus sp. NPDC057967]|uniref:hypothetical protein n=1 Tax=Paenibacillus sp. NPDC057967 TaxID=3346293 RepID=UPI0036D76D16
MKKKLVVTLLSSVMLLASFTYVFAATHTSTATVTGGSSPMTKSGSKITGGHKYAKLTCTGSGSAVAGMCVVMQGTTTVVTEVVDTANKTKTNDVYLAGGKEYHVVVSYVDEYTNTGATVKGTLTYTD